MSKVKTIGGIIIILLIMVVLLIAAENNSKYALRAPNGLSFGMIKGYETWHLVASHYRTDKQEFKLILGNPIVVKAYQNGAGKNNQSFPEGCILVKIAYSIKTNADFAASVEPDVLNRVEYMVKDSNRFKDTGGWGYARFLYDANSAKFTPYGKDSTFATECYSCHIIVAKKDFVFTDYVNR
jgi:hypothetical protein